MLQVFRLYKFNQMSIITILESSNKEIIANLDILAKDYKEKLGKEVCKTCPSSINLMVLSLKNHYNMTQFRFKRAVAHYKNKKGDKTTISNSTMTDEKAIEFLKTNPERITLFSEFPSNWEQLIVEGLDSETEAEKEKRLAKEAEAKAAGKKPKAKPKAKAKPKQEKKEGGEGKKPEAQKPEAKAGEMTDEEKATAEAEKAANEALKESGETLPKKADLEKMKLNELREKYPDIKATKTSDFIEKLISSGKAVE